MASYSIRTSLGNHLVNGSSGQGTRWPLSLPKTVRLSPLCMGRIEHNLTLECNGTGIWMIREPGVLETYNLLVDQGPLDSGPIVTTVFNLSDNLVRIPKGEVISWIMSMW